MRIRLKLNQRMIKESMYKQNHISIAKSILMNFLEILNLKIIKVFSDLYKIDLIEKKDGDDEKDIRYKIEQKIKENRLKEEKQAPNFTDPKFLEAINKYKSKS